MRVMLRVPKKIRIGCFDVRVEIVDDPHWDSRGEYLIHDTRIKIKKQISAQQVFSVFVHEYIEGVSDVHHLELTEGQICSLEQEMTSLIKQLEVNSNGEA